MVSFTVNTIINQPKDIVVKALMIPENHTYWTTNLEKFEVIEGKPGEAGSIGHLHYVEKGKSYLMEDKLIHCDPGTKYVSEVKGEAIKARVETLLESTGNRTKMSITWIGKGKVLVLRLLLPLLRNKIKSLAQKDLDKFKNLVETIGIDFSK